MTAEFRYILEKGSRKHSCPECGKKTFVRYQDAQTSEYLPGAYGRCDREIKCGYHHNPYADHYNQRTSRENSTGIQTNLKRSNKPRPNGELFPIPQNVLFSTLGGYEQNLFVQNLLNSVPFPFDVKDVERVIGQYYLGTIKAGYMSGAVTFPFIDFQGRVMAIQVKQFDHNNHATRTSFLHSMIEHETKEKGEPLPEWLQIYNNNEKKVSCLFGAHLLSKYPGNPVALVEAPKSAIYGALYFGFPKKSSDLLWLAVYSLSSLTLEKCEALRGRRVILFPDLSKDGEAFKLWSQKAREHEERLQGTQFVLSDLLEKNASEEDRENGLDIADYLIRMDWQRFRKPRFENESHKEPQPDINLFVSESCEKSEKCELTETKKFFSQKIHREISVDGSEEIKELEAFFLKRNLPPGPLQLNQYTKIIDPTKFVDAHIITLKAYEGKRIGEPVYDRLKQLKQF